MSVNETSSVKNVIELKEKNSEDKCSSSYELDTILNEIGNFGKFHIFLFLIVGFPIFLSSTAAVGFVFTAGDLDYHCNINECDNKEYNPLYLENAVPFKEHNHHWVPVQCERFSVINQNFLNFTCDSSEFFNKSKIIKCENFIYKTNEVTIVNEFNLTCDENKWKLALVGTLHHVGYLLNLLVTGYLSDKYGRLKVFIGSVLSSAVCGIFRAFSWNYLSFLLSEFIDAVLGAGVYTAGFILSMEFLTPEYRGLGIMLFVAASFGKIGLGLIAMGLQDFRMLLLIMNIPGFIAILYTCFAPESVRWLLVEEENEKAGKVLLQMAKINNTKLSDETIDLLQNKWERITLSAAKDDVQPHHTTPHHHYEIKDVFKYPKLLIRICICSYIWLTNVFVFYGLTITAVAIGGNKYTDFSITSAVEIPALFLVYCITNRVGRKKVVCISLIISGISLFSTLFVPSIYWVNLILFMLGKFAITTSFSTIYIYTSELFPTSLRHTLLGFCSSFGRFGSILAPQAPILANIFEPLPMILFSGTALIAGLLTLTFPETLHTKLPDTIEEALEINKDKQKI